MAVSDMEYLSSEAVNKGSSSFIFKNAYDTIRAALTAHMALEGCSPYSHTAVIAYARDVLEFSDHTVSKLNKFRKLRNGIRYRAETATVKETEEIRRLMQDIVGDIRLRISRQ